MAVDNFVDEVIETARQEGWGVDGNTLTPPPDGTKISRIVRARQMALPGVLPDVEEEVAVLNNQISMKADRILARAEQGAFSETTKIGYQFATAAGILMDAVLTLKIDAKPSKIED